MNRALRHGKRVGLRLESDLSESLLILSEILGQDVHKRLGLLRADVDSLAIFDEDLVGALLMNDAEGEEEVPDADAYLNAVGVVLSVVVRLLDLNLRLRMAGMHSALRVKQAADSHETAAVDIGRS